MYGSLQPQYENLLRFVRRVCSGNPSRNDHLAKDVKKMDDDRWKGWMGRVNKYK